MPPHRYCLWFDPSSACSGYRNNGTDVTSFRLAVVFGGVMREQKTQRYGLVSRPGFSLMLGPPVLRACNGLDGARRPTHTTFYHSPRSHIENAYPTSFSCSSHAAGCVPRDWYATQGSSWWVIAVHQSVVPAPGQANVMLVL